MIDEAADGLLSPVPVFLDSEPEGEAYAYVVDGESCEYEVEPDREGTGTGDRSPPDAECIDMGSLSARGREVLGAGREDVDVRGVLGCVLDVVVFDIPSIDAEVTDLAKDPARGLPMPELELAARTALTLLLALAPSPTPGIGGNVLSLLNPVVVVVKLTSSSHSPYIPSEPFPYAPGEPFPNAPSDPLLNRADEGRSGDPSGCPTLRFMEEELPPD